MQFILLTLALFVPVSLMGMWAKKRRKADLQHEWNMMSQKQLNVLTAAYIAGHAHDLGESMRAICWQESSFGINLINEEDGTEGSYGYFGANPIIVATRVFKTWPNKPTDSQVAICKRALMKFDYSAKQCVAELQYWIGEYLHGEWSKVWASYNAGYDYEDGRKYARDIKEKIMFLRRVL